MKVLKFGGSSVANADRLKAVADLLRQRIEAGERLTVVLSAFGGVTDQLIEAAQQAEQGDSLKSGEAFEAIRARHIMAVDALFDKTQAGTVKLELETALAELSNLLTGVNMLREVSPRTMDYILSFGERCCVYIFASYLESIGIPSDYTDARKIIRTNENFGNAQLNAPQSFDQIAAHYEAAGDRTQVVTGFIGSDDQGRTTTLGRGGSDYTAAILAGALEAEVLEIWTDVDGVLTANPKQVSKAFTIPSLSYKEAMELSHFGAKVIYPPTIQPALSKDIPIYIRNTFNPAFEGTCISKESDASGEGRMTGLSAVSDAVLLTIQGTGLQGPGSAARFFGALSRATVNVIMITQASSEHSICIGLTAGQEAAARVALETEFERELEMGLVDPLATESGVSLVAVVGEQMKRVPGVAGALFKALGQNGVNVLAIAQGSTELNITFAIGSKDETKALNLLHDTFFLSTSKRVNIFLVGVGLIGSTLLEQIEQQRETLLAERRLDIRVIGLANSRKMHFEAEGIGLADWKEKLGESELSSSFEGFVEQMQGFNLSNSLFVDCTANPDIRRVYPSVLESSIAISTANKVAASSSQADYERLVETALNHNVAYMFETNVGAGLPVLSTLADIVRSGDKVKRIEAVVSGSLSFIFNQYVPGKNFADLVKEARQLGYTEPDPREDLSGADIKRKIIILSRVAGYQIEPSAVEVDPILPPSCMEADSVDSFFEALEAENAHFDKISQAASAQNARLRYIAIFEDGQASIKLEMVGADSPFYNLASTDNMIVFHTERYNERPLIVQGPGAGAGVTAAGVFAEIIQYGS